MGPGAFGTIGFHHRFLLENLVSVGGVTLSLSAAIFVTGCAVSDANTRRIPNAFVAAALAVALVLNAVLFGTAGLWSMAAGLLLGAGALFVPFVLGGVGGGDVKMMAAVGALLGPRLTAAAVVVGLIFGGVQAAVHLAAASRLRETLRRTFLLVISSVRRRSLQPLRVGDPDPRSLSLPYSVPLGIGTVLVLLIHMLGPA